MFRFIKSGLKTICMNKKELEKYEISDSEIEAITGGVIIEGKLDDVYDLMVICKNKKLPKLAVKYIVFKLWNPARLSTDQSEEDFKTIEKFIDENWNSMVSR